MKFWKILRKLLDEMFPDWQDKFISYKDMKKELNWISPMPDSAKDVVDDEMPTKLRRRLGDEGKGFVTKEMKDFVKLMEAEIKKFNGLSRHSRVEVLHEPFFRIEVLNKLVKECEVMIYRIFSRHEQLAPPEATCNDQPMVKEETRKLSVPEELAEIECMENLYLRLTVSALRTLNDIRKGSSTKNIFSLPPMQVSAV